MANEYLYGAYGHIATSVARSAVQAGTVPVYIGTAPIHLFEGAKLLTNYPIRLSGMADAQRKVGYWSADTENWNNFTLCEAISAHFDNSIGNVGPIYVINVLDIVKHKSSDGVKTVSLDFNEGYAEIESETIIVDTLELDGLNKEDYTLSYNFMESKLVIKITNDQLALTSVDAEYEDIDPSKITISDIIGGVTQEGDYLGLGAISLLYQEHNAVTNIIAAPGWSHFPQVYKAMVTASQKINGHWDAFVVADVPIVNPDNGQPIDTITKANNWKKENCNSERSKVYWPMAIGTAGEKYHLSSLAVATMQRMDFEHSSVPMETPGNKPVGIKKLYFGESSANKGYDQQTAKELTSNGISTAVYWGGRWVLWGDHTAAYAYGADLDPRGIFDVNMRMLMHITNSFQLEWGTSIDKPMSVQLKDTILVREQQKLDVLVTRGALIGTPTIVFLEIENPITDLMNGDFRWDISATPTPPLKSASVYVTYTDEGFQAYFGGES